ncbi:histone H1.4-like [Antechinus flavipes]|uniref:histone H1.4-like n=1 Tax=Antechinus flavipes TaxID=38775 RepID=UPI002236231D|nr:histone H1.4-like [Antechinus flavipes]
MACREFLYFPLFFRAKKHNHEGESSGCKRQRRRVAQRTNHSTAPLSIYSPRPRSLGYRDRGGLSSPAFLILRQSEQKAMSETAPAAPVAPAPAPAEKTPVKKKAKRAAGSGGARRKAAGPPVSELITKAVEASKERSGVSLAALKKALAAAGYDVEKNNSRIKLGLKSLVSKGTLVQTKGTGASGSFKLNKKASAGDGKAKGKKAAAAKTKKPANAAAKKTKKAAGAAGAKKSVKKTPKKLKKPTAVGAKKATKSPKKTKAAKPKKVAKSPAKAKLVKPKGAKPKAAKPKKAAPKKK